MPKNKIFIKDNKISAKNLTLRLSNIFEKNPKLALTDVLPCFHYDENRKRTDLVEAFKYMVLDVETFSSFAVRVNSTSPVITPEELAQADSHVFIEFPLSETIVKPFQMEYGVATVSIVAPYAQLVNPAEDKEENHV
ncbi:MAG: hypothetical protein HFI74_12330 [Lachnospiraceae bacterium]|jgi:hypothetical protein|nr:hypothetical protein [Lachnospiraceae bacterium]